MAVNVCPETEGRADNTRSFRAHVLAAVAALRDLGRMMASASGVSRPEIVVEPSPSCVPLSTLAFFADALLEQIDRAENRSTPLPRLTRPARAPSRRVATDQLAECVERHLAAHLARPADAVVMSSERIRRFIEVHYAEALTLTSIAVRLGCTRSFVATAFKRDIGETPHHYIAGVRVRRAVTLIAEGVKIEAVMMMVGYRSKKNFYRQFKLRVGLTPGEYRSRVCGGNAGSACPGQAEPRDRLAGDAEMANGAVDGRPVPPAGEARMGDAAGTASLASPVGPSVTVPRAAELLHVSKRTVYYWIHKRQLQALRPAHGGRRILVSSFPASRFS